MDVMEKTESEKRLIDANALIKEANADGAYGYVDAKQIADAPTIDAVEVVRCMDCKYYEIHKPKVLENCERNGYIIPMKPGDFCSYGEKRRDKDGTT